MRHRVLQTYDALKREARHACASREVRDLIGELLSQTTELLRSADRAELTSKVDGKRYFAFTRGNRLSRAINADLFAPEPSRWMELVGWMDDGGEMPYDPHQFTRTLYGLAVSFCAAVDLLKDDDQKTPGTFFEYFIAHFFAWRVGVEPETSIQILNVDGQNTRLQTDFVFNLGPSRQKFHMPIKTSSRERSIMLWAHQRLLDGAYGIERFMGTPVLLAETKMDKARREVVEICLPDQWRVYQSYIAKLKRVYYLDLPAAYERLNAEFPPLRVREFGEFFAEWSELAPA